MKDGALQQTAAPMELYRRPANRFVAGFIGSPPMNFFQGTLARDNGSLVFRGGNENGLAVPLEGGLAQTLQARVGQPVTLGLRPGAHRRSGRRTGGSRGGTGGGGGRGEFRLLFEPRRAVCDESASRAHRQSGDALSLRFDMAEAHFFDSSTGQSLA